MGDVSAFAVHDEAAHALFGSSPTLELLHENKEYPFAHEAGVFIDADQTLFITSNQYADPSTGRKKIQISKVTLSRAGGTTTTSSVEEIHPDVAMGNGGVNYQGGVLFCAQGGADNATQPAALVHMAPRPPYATRTVVSSFHGRAFNSLNDVVVHSDGSIWVTDPIYGWEQGIRPAPELPCQVYRFCPGKGDGDGDGAGAGAGVGKGSIRAVADGFGRPNGICFSPDEKVVYITDTDWIHGDGTTNLTRASTM